MNHKQVKRVIRERKHIYVNVQMGQGSSAMIRITKRQAMNLVRQIDTSIKISYVTTQSLVLIGEL